VSELRPSPLLDAMQEEGALTGTLHDRQVVRHFGSPAEEYAAASEAAAVFDRSHRTRLRIRGRAPGQMLDGILTGTLPVAPTPTPPLDEDEGPGRVLRGRATYHCVLTPKGKVVSDLWTWSLGPDEAEDGYLLDVPVAGRDGLLEHFGTFLPPRMARVEDVSDTTAMIAVTGPDAAADHGVFAHGRGRRGLGAAARRGSADGREHRGKTQAPPPHPARPAQQR